MSSFLNSKCSYRSSQVILHRGKINRSTYTPAALSSLELYDPSQNFKIRGIKTDVILGVVESQSDK
jgi:hypothetical protein